MALSKKTVKGDLKEMIYLEMLAVLLLLLANGMLAMSELAIVSARSSRVRHMAGTGNRGARLALRLINDPSRFLATVQIGITLVGVLAGAFGGATIADRLGDWLDGYTAIVPHGDAIGIGIVVVAVTYLSIVIGELVPKRIALSNPEWVASHIARPMTGLAHITQPAVWLLKVSTDVISRPLGLSDPADGRVTEEEVKAMIAEGTRSGIFLPQERRMIEGVLRLADRKARAIMTPKTEIAWLPVDADGSTIKRILEDNTFSRLLVCSESVDHVEGMVHTRDLLATILRNGRADIRGSMGPVIVVPQGTPALELLERFRRERIHLAVVVDEYGITEGLVTLADVLEAIAGDFPEPGEVDAPTIVRRPDGSLLVDGLVPVDELRDVLRMPVLGTETSFDTVAGFVLHHLGHLPSAGEAFTYADVTFEVIDMDQRRIDKILV